MSLEQDVEIIRTYLKRKYKRYANLYVYKSVDRNRELDETVKNALEYTRLAFPECNIGNTFKGTTRKREVVAIKQALMYILRRERCYKSSAIARAMGMHHATVLHAEKVGDNMIATKDELFLDAYDNLTKYLTDVGLTESDNKKGLNPKSMSLAIFHKGENITESI
tara:strand:+ start:175 stop:672 length:498 start_codon:yes stop_codon:yes gene_type:complete